MSSDGRGKSLVRRVEGVDDKLEEESEGMGGINEGSAGVRGTGIFAGLIEVIAGYMGTDGGWKNRGCLGR
jgi:hypothetical protein